MVISVSGKKRQWLDLERKISRGISLEEAAVQCGIPLSDVFNYVNEKMAQIDTLNFELRLIGQGALKKALTKLTELAGESARAGKDFESTDLLAARELAKLAVDALKLSRSGVAGTKREDAGADDLFDRAPDPWKLKKIE